MPSLFLASHPVDGEAIDPQEGNEADESDTENDAYYDAGADVGILAGIIGELSLKNIPLLACSDVCLCGKAMKFVIGALLDGPRC
jgi:hypothetical protein